MARIVNPVHGFPIFGWVQLEAKGFPSKCCHAFMKTGDTKYLKGCKDMSLEGKVKKRLKALKRPVAGLNVF